MSGSYETVFILDDDSIVLDFPKDFFLFQFLSVSFICVPPVRSWSKSIICWCKVWVASYSVWHLHVDFLPFFLVNYVNLYYILFWYCSHVAHHQIMDIKDYLCQILFLDWSCIHLLWSWNMSCNILWLFFPKHHIVIKRLLLLKSYFREENMEGYSCVFHSIFTPGQNFCHFIPIHCWGMCIQLVSSRQSCLHEVNFHSLFCPVRKKFCDLSFWFDLTFKVTGILEWNLLSLISIF